MAKRERYYASDVLPQVLGDEAAESDDLSRIIQFFVSDDIYQDVIGDSRLLVVIAHKGVGKTCLLRRAAAALREQERLVFEIDPNEIFEIPVEDGSFVGKVEEWKAGLRYLVVKGYLEQMALNGDRLREVREVLLSSSKPLFDQLKAGSKLHRILGDDVASEISEYLQAGALIAFIDDLDLGWHHASGTTRDIERIATLFQALRALKSEQFAIRFRVAIRTDVFMLVHRAYVDAGKIRQDCRWYRWSNHELLVIMAKRVNSYRAAHGDRNRELKVDDKQLRGMTNGQLGHFLIELFEPSFTAGGPWKQEPMHRTLLTLVRKRPRDLIALIRVCSQKVRERLSVRSDVKPALQRIVSEDIIDAYSDYSAEILADALNEYKGELPKFGAVVRLLKPTRDELARGEGLVFSTSELTNKLTFVLKSSVDAGDPIEFAAKPDKKQSGGESIREMSPESLLEFLFRINFIVRRSDVRGDHIRREFFDESRYAQANLSIDTNAEWEIHPAFWPMLIDSKSAKEVLMMVTPIADEDLVTAA